MGLLNDVKTAMGMGQAKKVESKPEPKKKKKSEKEIATEAGEAWVSVLKVEVDPDNPGNGAFELDWNEHFIKKLWSAGYKDEDENDIVDRWFQDVCRHVVLESYENDEAMVTKNDLGDGRTEYR
jgi:hypothetical protein|tara:strand:- start:69 stop:440 length:372 start_codon:yes stop_codon:yes gene_type:complete